MISLNTILRKRTQPEVITIDIHDMVAFPVVCPAFGRTTWQRAFVVAIDEASQRALIVYLAEGDNRVSSRVVEDANDVQLVKKASALTRRDIYGFQMLDAWIRNFEFNYNRHLAQVRAAS